MAFDCDYIGFKEFKAPLPAASVRVHSRDCEVKKLQKQKKRVTELHTFIPIRPSAPFSHEKIDELRILESPSDGAENPRISV